MNKATNSLNFIIGASKGSQKDTKSKKKILFKNNHKVIISNLELWYQLYT